MEKFCNEAYFRFFNALANRMNLAIIDLLMDGSKCISDIADFLGQEPATVSRNLEQLQGCALIHSGTSQRGKLYTLNKEIVVPLGELLAFHAAKHCPGLRECIPEAKLREYLKKEAAKETYIEHWPSILFWTAKRAMFKPAVGSSELRQMLGLRGTIDFHVLL